MHSDTYIIVPAYNEGKVIKAVIDKLSETFENVVCVDDGSQDNTFEELGKTSAMSVKHFINLGQGASLQTGVELALLDNKARYFVTFDADGQHRISDALKMLDKLKENEIDIVLGSRFIGEKETKMPLIKRIVLKLGVGFTNTISGVRLTDSHNGLRVFNRKFAEGLDMREAGMGHASEIIDIIRRGGYKYMEVPVTIDYTKYSLQKGQSMLNAVNLGLDSLINFFRG